MAAVERVPEALTRRFLELYPHEVASLLENVPATEVAELLSHVPVHEAAMLFDRLRRDVAANVIESLSPDVFRDLVGAIELPKTAAALARLDPEARARVLTAVDAATAAELTDLMVYRPDSAGGIMDTQITTFRPESSYKDAVARLRKLRNTQISDIFLVDVDGVLIGNVTLQDLVSAEPGVLLGDLRKPVVHSVPATAPRDEIIELFEASKAASMAVVDFHGRVLGVIRQAALIAAVQNEASADVQTMVGASKDEHALSSVWFAVRRRLPWLQVNLLTAFLAAAVVGMFEGTIARFTALAVLLPVVAGQSGNTGAQALAVTMRGLALREIRSKHWFRVALKEVGAGAINGLAVAGVTGIAVYIWSDSAGLAAVIVGAMIFSMAIAGLAGASVPIVLHKLGQDPAQASSIILTTVTDVMGFLSFLGLATLAAGSL